MKESSEILQYLSEIEKEIKDTDLTTKILIQELSALQQKQISLSVNFKRLKDLYVSNLNKQQDYTKQMARELIKNDRKVIQLKNGQVNTAYHDQIDLDAYSIPSGATLIFKGIDELVYSNSNQTFEGTPLSSGEFIGTLSYELEEGGTLITKEVHFLVNADPRSLWQENEPAPNEPYAKPHKDFTLIKAANRTLVSASLRGKSHAHKGTFREDEFTTRYFKEDGWMLQVVADGAGSAKYSRQGSKLACNSVSKQTEEMLKSNLFQELEASMIKANQNNATAVDLELKNTVAKITTTIAHNAHITIAEYAINEGYNTNDFATTLLFTLTKDFDFGTIVIHFSIGDGAIATVSEQTASLLMNPDGGEFSGQTCFLTERSIFDDAHKPLLYQRSGIHLFPHKIDYLFLMTDGISDPKFSTENNLKDSNNWIIFTDDLKPVLQSNEEIEMKLFNWLDFYIPGEYDDRTISILY